MPQRSLDNEINSIYYHDYDYETEFDYYKEEDYYVLKNLKNTFERLFSKIPKLSERQAGVFSFIGPIFAGIFGLVSFTGKNNFCC